MADSNGHLSNTAIVDVNVGVNVGTTAGDDHTVTFTATGGAVATLSLNRGNVMVLFSTPAVLTVNKKGQATVNGSPQQITGLQLSNTTAASTLSITSKGTGTLNIQGITDASPIKTISAPKAILSGTVSLSGTGTLQVAEISDAVITVGTGVANFSLVAGPVIDSSLTSSELIKVIKAISWSNSAGASFIKAPTINSLVTTGNFQAKLTTTGGSYSLGNVHIAGQVGVGAWSVTGNTRTLVFGSAAIGWGGLAVSGNLTNLTVANGNLTSNISAGSITTLKVAGAMAANVTTKGNLNTLQAAQLVNAVVDVGSTASNASSAATSNLGSSTLGTLHLTSKVANTFNDSSVIARTIKSVTTGQVNIANGGTPEGIASGTIDAASITANGEILHLSAKSLLSDSAIAAFLTSKNATLGTFTLAIV